MRSICVPARQRECVQGAKFELWVSKDKTENGTYQKLNDTFYYTDENGIIELPELDTGWYKVKEVEPPEGYMLKEPSEQTLYVEHDKGSTITFENIPKSALVIPPSTPGSASDTSAAPAAAAAPSSGSSTPPATAISSSPGWRPEPISARKSMRPTAM